MNLRRLLVVPLVATGVLCFAPAPRASATGCAPTASGVSVAVVIDFGDGSPVSAVCVPADSSDNGAAVLAARARQLGTPAPRFDSSGFVCGIDGYPSSGCGEQNGSTYAYWSYWHGTSESGASWEYSNVGPGGSRVHADVVEGWRFQPQGAGNPTDPPPSGSPDHMAICAPPTTTTTTATTTSPTASGQAVNDPAPVTTATNPLSSSSETATTSASTSTTATTTATTATTTATTAGSSQVAAGPVRVSEPAKKSSPWPAIGAGVAIVGLIGGGVFAARRRGEASP